jgi:hypothetical protein
MRAIRLTVVAVVVLAAAGLFWLLGTRIPPPLIPGDRWHREAGKVDDCLTCHAPDGPAPRTKNHPNSQRCFQCHERNRAGA